MKTAWFLSEAAAGEAASPRQLPQAGWRQVSLPHQWTLDGEEAETGWYRLEIPSTRERRWVQVWADYYTEAWIDGEYQGVHEGYLEPWVFEAPPDRQVILKVSAPKESQGTVWPDFKRQIKGVFGQHHCRPGGNTYRGQERGTGGLWGGVRTFRTGAAALLHVSWQAVKVAVGWKLRVDLDIDVEEPAQNEGSQASRREAVEMSLTPLNFKGESLYTRRELDLTADRKTYSTIWDLPDLPTWETWERGFPHLYELNVRLDDSSRSVRVGFRTIAQEENWVVLNGSRLFIRGTNIIPTQWLASYTRADAERDVRLLAEAHLNAVRVHAHLTHPAFYSACDRAGILVWQDFPLQWGYAVDEKFAQEAVRQAQAMVKWFGSHTCIYLWCAHNEPAHNRNNLDLLLASALRQADPTRLVKEASSFREHPYPGWYWGHYRDFLAAPGGPLPSEFGAQALPSAERLGMILGEAAWPPDWDVWGYHNFQPDQTLRVARVEPGDDLATFVARSQAYQAQLIKFAIESYRRAKGKITGYYHFMFVEPWEGISSAVLEANRDAKAGYYALQAASTPVLLSFLPHRKILEVGQMPIHEAWVINDLARSLEGRVTFRLEGPQELELVHLLVRAQPQSAQLVFHIGDYYESCTSSTEAFALSQALHSLPPGDYFLIGEVWEGETLVSHSEVQITYMDPTLGPPSGAANRSSHK
jgi:beta-mannosidase